MQHAVREPREDVEKGVGVSSLEVADVCAVQHALQGGKQRDVDGRAVLRGDEAGAEKGDEPGKDRGGRVDKLRGDG